MKKMAAWTFGFLLFGGGAWAAELKVGDSAPEFALAGTDGKSYRLSDLKGKTVVLAWFPKAFTSG